MTSSAGTDRYDRRGEEDVDRLHRGGEEREEEACQHEPGTAPGAAAEDDDHHPGQRDRERGDPPAVEVILAEEDGRHRDDRRVGVEAEERDRDARPLEGEEDPEVEDHPGDGRDREPEDVAAA